MVTLYNQDIPDDVLESLAQMLLPEIQKFYDTDEIMEQKQQNDSNDKPEHD